MVWLKFSAEREQEVSVNTASESSPLSEVAPGVSCEGRPAGAGLSALLGSALPSVRSCGPGFSASVDTCEQVILCCGAAPCRMLVSCSDLLSPSPPSARHDNQECLQKCSLERQSCPQLRSSDLARPNVTLEIFKGGLAFLSFHLTC